MPRKGRKFEIAYADLFSLNDSYYNVESPKYMIDKITGEQREVDVFANYKDESDNERCIAIECRDRNHNQDVTWIEQLVTKKNDLGIDLMIAITTKDFSKSAIEKAANYGVVLEKGELINSDTIENKRKEFFCDVHYLIIKLKKLNFLLSNGKSISIKDLFKNINIIEQKELMTALKYGPFIEIDIHRLLEELNIKDEDFYNNDDSNNAVFNNITIVDKSKAPPIINKMNIVSMEYQMCVIPHKITLFLNKSLSTFTVGEKKSNKSYKAVFGNDDDNITVGYMNDNKVTVKVNLKPRKYHRLVGGSSTINTVFPKDADVDYDISNVEEVTVPDIDYDEVL